VSTRSSSTSSASSSPSKNVLGVVFVTIFLDLVGFGILIPIQPFLAENFGASPKIVTLLGASYSLMQFLFAPFWGRLSDRIGRRPVMLISIFLGSLGYLGFALSRNLSELFIARLLSGFGNANLGAAQAVIADSTTHENRAKGMGLIGAAFGLGFIFGPALGGFFGQWGLAVPVFVAAGLGFLNWLWAYWALPETRKALSENTVQKGIYLGLKIQDLKVAWTTPNVPIMLLIFLLGTTGFSMMEQVLGLLIEFTWVKQLVEGDHARIATRMTSTFLVIVGVTATIVQGGLIGKLVKRFGERRLMILGPCITSVGMLGLVVTSSLGIFPAFLAVAVILACGTGITSPSQMSLLSRFAPVDSRGAVLGVGQSAASFGRFIGPAFSGWIFESHTQAPFILGALFLLTCALLASRLPRLSHG
jgi:DHA1 family tetracycline resistance protein-like MFS transporter